MPSSTSTTFPARRESSDGLIRETISLSGSTIGRLSFAPESSNNLGKAARISPKEVLTEPWASCERACSTGMETTASGGGVWVSFARRSSGNTATMDDNGNCRLPWPAAGATDCGLSCGAAAGVAGGGGAAAATDCGGAAAVASLLSKRRSMPRINPANFDFTMFDMNDYPIPGFA
jgi:hypothetical protein